MGDKGSKQLSDLSGHLHQKPILGTVAVQLALTIGIITTKHKGLAWPLLDKHALSTPIISDFLRMPIHIFC